MREKCKTLKKSYQWKETGKKVNQGEIKKGTYLKKEKQNTGPQI